MKFRNFDVSESLDSPEMIREYLQQVIADGDMAELTRAIGHVAKANGMTEVFGTCQTGTLSPNRIIN